MNLGAFLATPFLGPVAGAAFRLADGWLVGRDQAKMAAARHCGRAAAGALRRRHRWRFLAAGTLAAAALTVPRLNLVMPVVTAAAFTHLLQRPGGAA